MVHFKMPSECISEIVPQYVYNSSSRGRWPPLQSLPVKFKGSYLPFAVLVSVAEILRTLL